MYQKKAYFYQKNNLKEKRGQFYIGISLVVVSLIIAVILISNYVQKKAELNIEKIAEDIDIEGEKTLDYASANTSIDKEEFIKNFTYNFGRYTKEDVDIYTFFGNKTNIKVHKYSKGVLETINPLISIDKASIEIDEIKYEFELREGDNLYFIIVKESDGEKYVIQK